MITIRKKTSKIEGAVDIPLSKSLYNRQEIIRAISGNLSDDMPVGDLSDDSRIMHHVLRTEAAVVDVGPAGTVMRFFTAYACLLDRTTVIRGSQRMHQRPIKILVDALRTLGAKIDYLDQEGYPPLRIHPKSIQGGRVAVSGSVSSQYITALLLIGPALPDGLHVSITPPRVSQPYVEMTLQWMQQHGIMVQNEGAVIVIRPQSYTLADMPNIYDWSAASFWYALVALRPESSLLLRGLKKDTLQGDAIVPKLYRSMGVETSYDAEGVRLHHTGRIESSMVLDCTDFPDLALPIATTCAGLGIGCQLTGLETLRIKECNRIEALHDELKKFGLAVTTSPSSLSFLPTQLHPPKESLSVHEDHRIAMSLAPLAAVVDEVRIEEEAVVKKSYPRYWEMMESFFIIEKNNINL